MKTNTSFRDFRKEDVEPCVKLIVKTIGKNREKRCRKELLFGLANDSYYSFLKRKVVTANGKVIAIVGVYNFKSHPKNMIGIDWFAIDSKYQNKGIGTKLVKWCIVTG